MVVSRNANKALSEWELIDNRLLYARFKSVHGNISMLVCYAPTNNAPDDMKDYFYEKLQEALGRVARHVFCCALMTFTQFWEGLMKGLRNEWGS